jgi:hypothetical protein
MCSRQETKKMKFCQALKKDGSLQPIEVACSIVLAGIVPLYLSITFTRYFVSRTKGGYVDESRQGTTIRVPGALFG